MESHAEHLAQEQVTRENEERFRFRLDDLQNNIQSRLEKVMRNTGLESIENNRNPSSDASDELKGRHLVDCYNQILDKALPKAAITSTPSRLGDGVDCTADALLPSSQHQNPLYVKLELGLGPGSEAIRLLELLPGTGDGPVETRLFCVQNPQERPYEALSYTWGAKFKSRTIQVNGQPVHVNENLFNALLSLRLEDRSQTLWVDALCINQKDITEKQAQVAMMGTIYHGADTVLIFLGMPTAQSYTFFDFVDRGPGFPDITDDNVGEIAIACGLDEKAVLTSFVELAQSPWWTRVWVLQEHYMARNEIKWYIGSRYIAGAIFCRDLLSVGYAAIQHYGPLSHPEAPVTYGLDNCGISNFVEILKQLSGTLYSHRHNTAYSRPRRILAKLDRRAEDHRDYVYGIRELFEPHLRQLLPPDYTVSTVATFERLAAVLLIIDGWADMLWWFPRRLSGAGEEKRPSWLPDFTKRVRPITMELAAPSIAEHSPKTASCVIINRVLYLGGCLLDVVREVVSIPDQCEAFHALQRAWKVERAYCFETGSNNGNTYHTKIAGWMTDGNQESHMTPLFPFFLPLSGVVQTQFALHFARLNDEFKSLFRLTSAGSNHSADVVPGSTTEHSVASFQVTAHTDTHKRFHREGPQILRAMSQVRRLSGVLSSIESDFVTACGFDYENLSRHLRDAAGSQSHSASTWHRMTPSTTSSEFAKISYPDIIQAIRDASDGNETQFRSLLAVTAGAARMADQLRDYCIQTGHNPDMGDIVDTGRRAALELLRYRRKAVADIERRVELFGSSADDEIALDKARQELLNQERVLGEFEGRATVTNRIFCASKKTWDRRAEEAAEMFRGRDFLRTCRGLVGVSSPGVKGIKAGDHIIIIDGLSFPLVARRMVARSNYTYSMIGCATVRGVKPGHTCEDAVLPAGWTKEPKQLFMFE